MEYVIPALTAMCGFFFLMWKRATAESDRVERRAKAMSATAKARVHTSQIMQQAIDLRNEKIQELDRKRLAKKRELQIIAHSLAKTNGPADVAAAWNQEQ